MLGTHSETRTELSGRLVSGTKLSPCTDTVEIDGSSVLGVTVIVSPLAPTGPAAEAPSPPPARTAVKRSTPMIAASHPRLFTR
jgi:hypothetical protein